MFDRRKLSPPEGWRKAWWELGIVTLGVLVALTLGEIAEAWRWQTRAARSTVAIDAELARAAGVLDERVMVQPCLDRRLSELERLLKTARSSNSLPNVGEIGRPPNRPIQSAAWEDAVGSGILLHFNPRRRATLSLNYPSIQAYPQEQGEEQVLWATLRILENAPGPISDDFLSEASVSVARLRFLSYLNGISAQQVRDEIFRTGVPASYFIILDREGSRGEVAAAVAARPICQPLTAASPA